MNIEQIYERHVDTVYRVAMLYLNNPQDAEDATQNAFINLMKHPQTFTSEEHEKAWLIVTVTNLCKNQLSHWFRKKRTDFEVVAESMHEHEERDELLPLVYALPEELKTIVYMYYYEGYSTREISQYLQLNESTLRSKMQKARAMLKLELEEADE